MRSRADKIRREVYGDDVYIRGIVEFSSVCRRRCHYCGLNADNPSAQRFRMPPEEIVETVLEGADAGYRTVVLQSGEDPWYTKDIITQIIERIREKSDVAITLSMGERTPEELAQWRKAGADRYLLKHETSDEEIYSSLHPCGTLADRIACLREVKQLGYETGSGFMIGLPGQTAETIANDLLLLKELQCDMAGIGPFLPHPATPLAQHPPGDAELTERAVALARVLLPKIHLPATTALSVLTGGRTVFDYGANVVMKKLTPPQYAKKYEIYPTNFVQVGIAEGRRYLEDEIRRLGRNPI